MTPEEAINIYSKVKHLPRECHINWLKENFNPILKEINNEIKINWACSRCITSNMNTLIGWLDKQKINNA